jgi:DNA-binding transcriptional ArsR family regulator
MDWRRVVAIDCVAFCKGLADETRQRILQLLLEGERTVGEIVAAFDVSQPTISHHLNVLKQLHLVRSRREGQQVYYSIDHDNVVACCGRLIAKFEAEACCELETDAPPRSAHGDAA